MPGFVHGFAQTGSTQNPALVLGNTFTAEKPAAFGTFRGSFADMMMITPLLADVHVNSLAETRE